MSDSADCAVCDHRVAVLDCRRCETPVCRLHADTEMGLCADCAEKAKPDDRRGDTFRY